MSRPPAHRLLTEIPKRADFTMDTRLWTAVDRYHKSVDANRFAVETFRELFWMGLSAGEGDNAKAVSRAARSLALRRAYAFTMSEISMFLNDLRGRCERAGAEAEASAVAEAQMLVAEQMAREREGGL